MSKFVSIILSIVLAFSMFSSCRNQSPGENNTTTQHTDTQGSENSETNTADVEYSPEQNKLLSVLYNEVVFVEESGRSVYLKDYSLSEVTTVYVVPDKYTFIDFDRDEKMNSLRISTLILEDIWCCAYAKERFMDMNLAKDQ